MPIHLLTTYYNENNQERKRELEFCINNNLNNKSITSVTILNQGGDLSHFRSNKLIIIDVKTRPTYNDFIDCIQGRQKNNNGIHIIANTDIYFDLNIGAIEYFNLKNKCFALSRWEETPDGYKLYNRKDSQDVWIFKGQLLSSLKCDYPIGVPRCDNRFLFDLADAGYLVKNPSYSIKAYHKHKNHIEREYKEEDNIYKIEGPYKYIRPHNLLTFIDTLLFNILHKVKLGKYVFDKKKLNNLLLVRAIKKI